MPGAANHRGSSKQDYATPPSFIRAFERRFGSIAFDLAATADNSVVPDYYDEVTDSLSQKWYWLANGEKWLWLNPPFGKIAPWAQKCREECRHPGPPPTTGPLIAFLVPASVDSNWWRDHVHEKARVYFLNGRLSFDGKNPFPKPCALCLYGVEPGYEVWSWKRRTVLFEGAA